MKLEFAFLADAAALQDNGMFAVVGGGFDLLVGTGTAPTVKPAMALVLKVMASGAEFLQTHELLVEIVGPDGNVTPPDTRVPFVPKVNQRHPERENATTICVNYQAIGFPAYGDYAFRISVGGGVLGQVNLEVVK